MELLLGFSVDLEAVGVRIFFIGLMGFILDFPEGFQGVIREEYISLEGCVYAGQIESIRPRERELKDRLSADDKYLFLIISLFQGFLIRMYHNCV